MTLQTEIKIHKPEDVTVGSTGFTRGGREWWDLTTRNGTRYADPAGLYGGQNVNLRISGLPVRLPTLYTFRIAKLDTVTTGAHPTSSAHVTVCFIARGPNGEVLFVQDNISSTHRITPGHRERPNGWRVTTVSPHRPGARYSTNPKAVLRSVINRYYPGQRLREWRIPHAYIGTESANKLDPTAAERYDAPAGPDGWAYARIKLHSLEIG